MSDGRPTGRQVSQSGNGCLRINNLRPTQTSLLINWSQVRVLAGAPLPQRFAQTARCNAASSSTKRSSTKRSIGRVSETRCGRSRFCRKTEAECGWLAGVVAWRSAVCFGDCSPAMKRGSAGNVATVSAVLILGGNKTRSCRRKLTQGMHR